MFSTSLATICFHFILVIILLQVDLNRLTISSSPIGHFQSLESHLTTAHTYLLSVNLVMCLVQRNLCFWYFVITSFTWLPYWIAFTLDVLIIHTYKCMKLKAEDFLQHYQKNMRYLLLLPHTKPLFINNLAQDMWRWLSTNIDNNQQSICIICGTDQLSEKTCSGEVIRNCNINPENVSNIPYLILFVWSI